MDAELNEASHHGYAAARVPESAQGSGWRIFFIVAGTICGLPVFVLSSHIFGSLGFRKGMLAVVLGTAISAVLGATSAYTGSRSQSGLALLADHAFGPLGSRIVKLVIAISLVGWFGVNIGVMGATAASALHRITGWDLRALAIGIPVSIAIALTTIRGTSGLERVGSILVPITLFVLLLSLGLAWPHIGTALLATGSGDINFGGAVSAVVGSYVVGIVIQPDYGRFVRKPMSAALGTGIALGVAYPLVMLFSSLASLAVGAPDLITAMIGLGFGLPALAVLMMGAWIDSSASLYSASLSFANQLPKLSFYAIVAATWMAGLGLVVVGADTAFIPFLVTLSIALPPLATILILSHFLVAERVDTWGSLFAALAWVLGTVIGFGSTRQLFTLTSLPVLDSILATAAIFLLGRLVQRRGRLASFA